MAPQEASGFSDFEPDWHSKIVQSHVCADIAARFESMEPEMRLQAWKSGLDVRQAILKRIDQYNQETREYLKLLQDESGGA